MVGLTTTNQALKPILIKKGRQPVLCDQVQNVPMIAIAKKEAPTDAPTPVAVPTLEQIFTEVTTEDQPIEQTGGETPSSVKAEKETSLCKPCIPPEHYLTHFPKHPECAICNQVKMQFSQHRSKKLLA